MRKALDNKQAVINDLQMEIVRLTNYDNLTGLPNKKYFIELLEEKRILVKSRQTSLAVIMLDIDGFTFVNEALGYWIGDRLVEQIAKRLQDYLGKETVLARYSGDQFAIVVSELNTGEMYEFYAKEILKVFKKTFKVELFELNMTASMGMIVYQGDDQDSNSLIKKANIALYWAKREGKNRLKIYTSDLSIQDYKQFQLRNDIKNAIAKKQFQVYYQPIVALSNSKIIAAEALIRWEHPEWGIVTPNEFIRLAEESGYIIELGNWVLREVCRNYQKWLASGQPTVKITINISPLQFFDTNFVENIRLTLEEFGLDPSFLIIEITESRLIEIADKVSSDIRKLHELGIQVALDDFGTGFSSLGYLSMFNIDILKIGRNFIKKIGSDKASEVITKSIIYMAIGLNLKLVAEGIENWEQLIRLKELNCYAGQGYLYNKPLPAEDLSKILSKGKCPPGTATERVNLFSNRRKYFRLQFALLLEGELTVLQINGKKVNVGNSKILIENIGPGGLCFISNLQLPVQREFIMKFKTQLQGQEVIVVGYTVWVEEMDEGLYKYGVELLIEENDRADLTKLLNHIQIKMKRNIMFNDGSFTSLNPINYFQLG